jgi:hypothetical protein
MSPTAPAATAVFVGPSVAAEEVADALPAARVEPPIGRGDLARLRGEGVETFVVIDGVFAHQLAVAPSEVVDVIAGGARVVGAASLGALRAAECWPAGMAGVGAVYRLFRLGVLRDDDEVAVATDPDAGHQAVSVALIHVRYLLIAALSAGHLDRDGASAILATARRTHFADRRWRGIFSGAGVDLSAELRDLIEPCDVKRRDARIALERVARGSVPTGDLRLAGRPLAAYRRSVDAPGVRYRGHDPFFGRPESELRQAVGLQRWRELESEGELDRELMRIYAARRLRLDSPTPA